MLTLQETVTIEVLHRQGKSIWAIAEELGRGTSTSGVGPTDASECIRLFRWDQVF